MQCQLLVGAITHFSTVLRDVQNALPLQEPEEKIYDTASGILGFIHGSHCCLDECNADY